MITSDATTTDDPDFYANAIAEHVATHIGPITNVFHELQSDIVQIDLLVVEPHEGRPFSTLITCGMSDRPMRVPIEDPDDLARVPELRFAELLVCLPADWPLTPEAFLQEEHYWPIRWLKRLARLPHQQQGWLGLGHTIPNGDPPQPFAANTRFCCWMIDQPISFADKLPKHQVKDKSINFYAVIPLFDEEVRFKLARGSAALGQALDRASVAELINLNRPSVVSR
jgi:hypothetical protein